MKVLVLLLLCVVVGSYARARPKLRGSMASKEWKMFKAKHHKVYKSPAEELMRFKIYLQNKRAILNHNNKQKRSMSTYSVQMNKFGDMLRSEYKALLGRRKRKNRRRSGGYYENSGKTLPENLDLRTLNLVNPPKNQGYVCGSCWSFSTTGSIEGQVAKQTGRLLDLSQQNMIDCVKLNGGCNGGYEYLAFEYARDYGVQLASSYPYEEKVGRCRADENEYRVYISGYKPIRSANETDLMDALYNVGPISVGIDSSSDMFKFYNSGVFAPDPTQCQASNIDHAVLAVGYGTDESGEDYWLIKNSWGPDWGEKGFVRVLRDGSNFCGIASDPVFPVL